MAYAVKYRITYATLADVIVKLEMLEDSYIGDVIEYKGTALQLQYIPTSDDPFEVVYASQLQVGIDVTTDLNNMPDFVTLNDRKYLCNLYQGTTLEWVGWALSDYVNFAFTTGIKELTFNAVDGLGLIQDIAFPEAATTNINSYKSLLYLICQSLSTIGYETPLNVFTQISFYATNNIAMNTRDTIGSAEPLNQTYTALTNILTSGVYNNSLDVLRGVLSTFGCRLFQARAKWNVVQMNEAAVTSQYFTEYDATGTSVIDYGTTNFDINIGTDLIWCDNSQVKILKKGFNNLRNFNSITFYDNYVNNGNMKNNDGVSEANGWNKSVTSGSLVINTASYPGYVVWDMSIGSGGTIFLTNVTMPYIAQNDKLKFGLTFYQITVTTGTNCFIVMKITTASGAVYYLDNGNNWVPFVNDASSSYFGVTGQTTSGTNLTSVFTHTTTAAPVSGRLTYGIKINSATDKTMAVSDFTATFESPFKSVSIVSEINATNQYSRSIDLQYGFASNFDGYFAFNGLLTDSYGNPWLNWFMYERPLQIFRTLAELLVKNNVNMYRKNIINLQGNIIGMGSGASRFSGNNVMTASDTDPVQISVTGKKYMLGNTTIDFKMNEINATLLEITNVDQAANIVVTYNNAQPATPSYIRTFRVQNGSTTQSITINYIAINGVAILGSSGLLTPGQIYTWSPAINVTGDTNALLEYGYTGYLPTSSTSVFITPTTIYADSLGDPITFNNINLTGGTGSTIDLDLKDT